MAYRFIVLVCVQALLLREALSLPTVLSGSSLNLPSTITNAAFTPISTNVLPSNILNGAAAQAVAPAFSPNWAAGAQAVPLVTEIVPNLQFGEISVDGDMPVGGMIKISGSFPVFGNVAVDGSVPSYGTAYVDTANVFQSECACFN